MADGFRDKPQFAVIGRTLFPLKLAQQKGEIFAVLSLDAKKRLIEYEVMFVGTLTQTSVHPHEVDKSAFICNAA